VKYKLFTTIFVLLCLSLPVDLKANAQPQRIISLGSFVTEGLFLLGVEDRIVGVTTYCNRPSRAKKKEKAGSIVDVNIEKVISLKPDLVIATPLTSVKTQDKLKSLGIRVEALSQVDGFNAICSQFLTLGKLVGKAKRAQQLITAARGKVKKIESQVKGLSAKKVFVQVGTKPLFTMNKKFFINDLIKRSGGINIAEQAGTGIYSREKVVKTDPDVIIIAAMGMAGEDEKAMWQKYKSIAAVKKQQIYLIDPDIICNPLPGNFADTLEKVAGFLHKEIRDER